MLIIEIDVDTVLYYVTLLLIVVVLLFMFLDVNYFARMLGTMMWAKFFDDRLKINETGVIYGKYLLIFS